MCLIKLAPIFMIEKTRPRLQRSADTVLPHFYNQNKYLFYKYKFLKIIFEVLNFYSIFIF